MSCDSRKSIYNEISKQLLRISCSDMATVVGLHPFRSTNVISMIEMVEKYIYQDLEELRLIDIVALDIDFISTEECIANILNKLGQDSVDIVANFQQIFNESEKVNTSSNTKNIIIKIDHLKNELKLQDKLTDEEVKLIIDDSKDKVKKRFGENYEAPALEWYEHITGYKINNRNDETISMLISSSHQTEKSSIQNDEIFQAENYFKIVGRIDGISSQLDTTSDDPLEWKAINVIVEIKNRIESIKIPPPLYDQIQLLSYMMILNCPHGDLVQCLSSDRQIPKRCKKESKINNYLEDSQDVGDVQLVKTASSSPSSELKGLNRIAISDSTQNVCQENLLDDMNAEAVGKDHRHVKELKITEKDGIFHIENIFKLGDLDTGYQNIQLHLFHMKKDGAPEFYSKHWNESIIPNLQNFHQVIRKFRFDDSIRYAWIVSNPDEKMIMLKNMLPYL